MSVKPPRPQVKLPLLPLKSFDTVAVTESRVQDTLPTLSAQELQGLKELYLGIISLDLDKILSIQSKPYIDKILPHLPLEYSMYLKEILTPSTQEKIRSLSLEQKEFIVKEMIPFSKNEAKHSPGTDTYNYILLTIAQMNDTKQDRYEISPIVLKYTELEKYLSKLKGLSLQDPTQLPLRKKFILESDSNHYTAGEFLIDVHGAKILFIDSMGDKIATGSKIFNLTKDEYLLDYYGKVFYNVFPPAKNDDENRNWVYFHDFPANRQNAPNVCTSFALDDMRHLFTIEHYLPSQQNLFKFIDKDAVIMNLRSTLVSQCDFRCKHITLPAPFIRTTQTRQLFQEMYDKTSSTTAPDETLLIPLGKEKPNLQTELKEFHDSGNKFPNPQDRSLSPTDKNLRLDYKTGKMAIHNLKFLLNHTEQEVTQAKKIFLFKESSETSVNTWPTSQSHRKPK